MEITALETKYRCKHCAGDFMVEFLQSTYLNTIKIGVSNEFCKSHSFEIDKNHLLKFNKIRTSRKLFFLLKSWHFRKFHSFSNVSTLTTQKIQDIEIELQCNRLNSKQIDHLVIRSSREVVRNLDEVFNAINNALQIEFAQNIVPAFGTLLGLMRSGSIITWDNDFDFWFKLGEDENDNVEKIVRLQDFFIKRGYIENKKSNFSITFRHPIDSVVVDFYFVIIKNTKIISYLISGKELDIHNFNAIDIRTESQLAKQILTSIYGQGWLFPDTGFKHQKVSRKEREELERLSVQYFSKV